ncbi:MAG TPA: hypothetical protein VMM83_05045 [Longimicrobiales bacterium]|nr:hypothetical protein [Longimicrobiales bacterium]
MNLILSLACEDARARPDGRLDVRGAFNELQAPGFPAAQDRMTVVFVMEWDAGERGSQDFTADLVADDGAKVLTIEGSTDVEPHPGDPAEGRAPPQTRLIMTLERVVFPHPGRYRFLLRIGGEVRETFGLYVSRAGE